MLVLDLDPGEGIEWAFVTETALKLRDLLKQDGFAPWPKWTGGKGLHLMIPLEPDLSHEAVHAYSKEIAARITASNPKRYTTLPGAAHRVGKVFIDHLRNGRGCTAVGTWSPRARAMLPIAIPTTWREVQRSESPGGGQLCGMA